LNFLQLSLVTARRVFASCSPTFRGGTRKLAAELFPTRGIFKKVSESEFKGEKIDRSNFGDALRSKQASGFAVDASTNARREGTDENISRRGFFAKKARRRAGESGAQILPCRERRARRR
jgi:hypothetical protein